MRGRPRRRAGLLAAALLLPAPGATAGHGMLNSFAGIEWLPAPGVLPGEAAYRLDDWDERLRARAARAPEARLGRCLDFAREKLAELEATVDARNAAGAARAVAAYRDRLACAASAVAAAGPQSGTLAERLATALLEHQYIVSTGYMDRPRDARRVIAQMIAVAAALYADTVAGLSAQRRESLFFREEEARWSWQMALAADEQGL